jgi:hypothetical protein
MLAYSTNGRCVDRDLTTEHVFLHEKFVKRFGMHNNRP